ncbi:MAG: hypothetical protein C0600_16360 [Ignavibacteria bacterium]|nr:MAG: hypothetical protein C0600_16360 [Ignavibacteria bacterium]
MQTFSAGNRNVLFSFMRENNFPVYHLSNFFYRDVEYAIRDYVRVHEGKDIGGREAGRLASEFVADLEKQEILRPHGKNTWILFDEEYSLKSVQQEEGESVAAAAEETTEG